MSCKKVKTSRNNIRIQAAGKAEVDKHLPLGILLRTTENVASRKSRSLLTWKPTETLRLAWCEPRSKMQCFRPNTPTLPGFLHLPPPQNPRSTISSPSTTIARSRRSVQGEGFAVRSPEETPSPCPLRSAVKSSGPASEDPPEKKTPKLWPTSCLASKEEKKNPE